VQCHKKEQSPSLTSLYTKELAGEHTWKHSIHSFIQGKESNTVLNDTIFSIGIINDAAIIFLKDTLRFTSKNVIVDGDAAIVDTATKLDYVGGGEHNFMHLQFYYHNNSITYTHSGGGISSGSTETYQTP
jgi:hypothetical protein